ncbi:uncharacterized protein [Littorina saxatilis]|uniref:Uncharacterized protein n=1 Tax=Littorina saxatilis TaxID=31220 RepID=A0AAN9B2D1_9CAEN
MRGCCRSPVGLQLLLFLVVVVTFCARRVTGLSHCTPWEIRSMPKVDYSQLSGDWCLVGRHDVGRVTEELWNAQIHINITRRQDVYSKDERMPPWFNFPYGCCIFYLDYFGGNIRGDQCIGKKYMWGAALDSQPGMFKHKLVGMPHYSMLYVLDTDYVDFAVIAHCTSAVAADFKFYCSVFNLFLLKRQSPSTHVDVVRAFDTSTTKNMLEKACKGDVWFKSVINTVPVCQRSSVKFTTPGVYEIGSL